MDVKTIYKVIKLTGKSFKCPKTLEYYHFTDNKITPYFSEVDYIFGYLMRVGRRIGKSNL